MDCMSLLEFDLSPIPRQPPEVYRDMDVSVRDLLSVELFWK